MCYTIFQEEASSEREGALGLGGGAGAILRLKLELVVVGAFHLQVSERW